MKKTAIKILSVIICIALALSAAVPAFAAGEKTAFIVVSGMNTFPLKLADGSNAFPLIIRQKFFEMARETAEYFKWQIGLETAMKKYDHIVLFGAGNMCRNYIKNFGEKYPPIFTCDNNKNLWGNDFEGIIVHSPEDLLKLDDPDHTGIFICNMYYTEIRKQLEDMGIKNIEYFSDEFLSLYNYDRLDMIERSLGEKNAE